ncbi:MAG: hypothetical protein ACK4UJ_00625 [Leptonema sp. (in: bacteria)]
MKRYLLLSFLLSIFSFVSISSKEILEMENQTQEIDFSRWIFLLTPLKGEMFNQNLIPFNSVQESQNNLLLHSGRKSYSGSGNGSGFNLVALKNNWQILFVNFLFPKYPNSDQNPFLGLRQRINTSISGNIFSIRYTFTKEKIQPFLEYSYFKGNGPLSTSKFDNFFIYSFLTNKWIFYPQFNVKVYQTVPEPKAGLSFLLPIQNWKVDLFYSYTFQRFDIKLNTSFGKVIEPGSFNEIFFQFMPKIYDFSMLESNLNPIDLKIREKYFNSKLGFSLFMDYRRFLALNLTVVKNMNFNYWTLNSIFNFIFSKHVGIIFFYQYEINDFVILKYWLIGPTFIFQI